MNGKCRKSLSAYHPCLPLRKLGKMKYGLVLFFFILFSCGIQKKNHTTKQLAAIWFPIKEEIAGTKIPPIVFQAQQLELKNKHYIMRAESVDRGTFQVKGNHMDIFGEEGPNAGKHLKAIFELKNNQLIICYDLEGKDYPTSFDTKNHPLYFMAVFERR